MIFWHTMQRSRVAAGPAMSQITCMFDIFTPSEDWDGHDAPALLRLDDLGGDVFRARFNQRNVNNALYGGQVVGQALAAAARTAEGRPAHSLHAYFLRPGATDARVTFKVERLLHGRNFATRRVGAFQNGKQILEMSCSFAVPRPGFVHQATMPDVPGPEGLASLAEIAQAGGDDLPVYILSFRGAFPIEARPMSRDDLLRPAGVPRRRFWFRVPSAFDVQDPTAQQCLLAYLSDFWLNGASVVAHRHPCPGDDLFVASFDHAVWFHRPANAGEWLLYDTESPSAGNSVNLNRGLIFARDGTHVATCAQEALQLPR
jgi:acyl-CoA thioesterase-2